MARKVFGNTAELDFTINYFNCAGDCGGQAFLAAPFYSDYEPVQTLTGKGYQVCLLIRLCSITTPIALRMAMKDPKVDVRYYTGEKFHSKFYIIGDNAIIGSANLTSSGLKSNRELSVCLEQGKDLAFDSLPPIFMELWDYADVLTEEIFGKYEDAHQSLSKSNSDKDFDLELLCSIPPCVPPSVAVGSKSVSSRRLFLQTFRRRYDEVVVPAIKEIENVFRDSKKRHPSFSGASLEIEISRFLGWLRIKHAPGESWADSELLATTERRAKIIEFLDLWVDEENIDSGDTHKSDEVIKNVGDIRSAFGSEAAIRSMSAEEVVERLTGCHAFSEQLRFTKGGLEHLKKEFIAENSVKRMHGAFCYLLHGTGDSIERAYDCIYGTEHKLHKFAESCVMELLGWVDPKRPPVNGRTMKALRFLGFDAK